MAKAITQNLLNVTTATEATTASRLIQAEVKRILSRAAVTDVAELEWNNQ